jgi:chemotaxis signal transduction protein
VTRRFGAIQELTAIPVSGECELATRVMVARPPRLPKYVIGLLEMEDEIVEVIDIRTMAAAEVA